MDQARTSASGAGAAGRGDRGQRRGVDAQPVLGGQLDQVLRGHRAGEVVVQVPALGQLPEEVAQGGGPVVHGPQIGVGARFRGRDLPGRRRGVPGGPVRRLCGGGQGGQQGQDAEGAERGRNDAAAYGISRLQTHRGMITEGSRSRRFAGRAAAGEHPTG
jgi:hypothetical protein